MSETVADALVERLAQWSVRRIYGYLGDGLNGVIGALSRAVGKITFVEPRPQLPDGDRQGLRTSLRLWSCENS